LVLTPRLSAGFTWEYQYDEDLLRIDYEYKLKNQYKIDIRYEPA